MDTGAVSSDCASSRHENMAFFLACENSYRGGREGRNHPVERSSSRRSQTDLEIGRQLNAETVAFKHSEMRHPWNRQDPALFAETARCWFDGETLPSGFEKL
jgi:hypothetical protein